MHPASSVCPNVHPVLQVITWLLALLTSVNAGMKN